MSAPETPRERSSERAEPSTVVEQVRVWDLPVRILHWLLVLSIVVLTVTGLYIAMPALTIRGEPGLFMNWVRFIHIVAGYVFIATIVGRIIWAFTGNRWARWDQFVPVPPERRQKMGGSLKFYLFLRRTPPEEVGHNPLAGVTYLVLFLMFAVQIFTGLALSALPSQEGVVWAVSGWVFAVASIPTVRLVHHLVMWLTLGFVVHHVYSAVLMDVVERSGIISSMVSGYKSLRRRDDA